MFSRGPNRAPRYGTIGVAVVLAILGAAATWGPVLPDKVGVWLFVASTVVMLLGVFLAGL
jgi:hypothetical protein